MSKKPHIPNPPDISLWQRKDGKQCMALVRWDKGASVYCIGEDFPAVEEKATDLIKTDLDRIAAGEDAKVARLMGRVKAKFEKAMK